MASSRAWNPSKHRDVTSWNTSMKCPHRLCDSVRCPWICLVSRLNQPSSLSLSSGNKCHQEEPLKLPHFSRSLLCWSKVGTVSSCALRSTMCRGTIPSPVPADAARTLLAASAPDMPCPAPAQSHLRAPLSSGCPMAGTLLPRALLGPALLILWGFCQPVPAGPTGLATRCAELHVADCYCEEAYGNVIVHINVPWLTLHINFKGKTLWINIRSSYYAVKFFAIIVLLQRALRDSENSCV